jgi:hypothetical protein
VLEVGVGQIDGADVGVEALGDQVDDVVQGLGQVVGSGDDPGDVREQADTVRNGDLLWRARCPPRSPDGTADPARRSSGAPGALRSAQGARSRDAVA